MFSQLGPLFKTQFRKTEKNDTRQHIPHEEHDAAQKKYKGEKEKEAAPKWEDEATVSVASLRAFLIDFLKTLPGAKDSGIDLTNEDQNTLQRPHEPQRPSSTKNAKAVRAYQTMAKHAAPIETEKNTSPIEMNKTLDTIKSKEYRDIYKLIQSLEALSAHHVTELHIFKSRTFVESLKTAVNIEKKRLRLS